MSKGKFIFQGIQEGDEISYQRLEFNPPLLVNYNIVDKIDKETGKENYSNVASKLGYATFDFGMEIQVALDEEHNVLINGYEGLSAKSDPIDILMKSIMYDLFHAFFQAIEDPNYTHYHWALYGNLKDRATASELD